MNASEKSPGPAHERPAGVPIVDLGAEYRTIQKDVDAVVHRVLSSGSYILGPENDRFERSLARYCGAEHAIGVNSGTDAILLALAALGISRGDEVILPAMSFIASAEPVVTLGAKPVFVDIDPISFTLDPSLVAAKMTSKTKAVMAVHLYGQTADMSALKKICERAAIPLMEDMAQAIGSRWQNQKAGSLGAIAALSFFPTKNLGACGDAGAVLTSSAAMAEHVRSLRNHGAKVKYHHDEIGYNSRLDELQAGILSVKLAHLDAWNERRRSLASAYHARLKDLPVTLPQEAPGRHHIYHLYSIRSPKRDALKAFLAERGISTGLHYPAPLHLQPALAYLGHREGDFPVSEALARETLSLPLYPQMTDDQVEIVCQALRAFCSAKS
ncbi:MAG TPA: DegT/DnrJ/EryC1/StrS family aminotransferase [Elusimicrobiota bacterium]|nr:DegT/DnrJ/EryC1/StrS family aminotransferase [Elusimicrobiota bacterium]